MDDELYELWGKFKPGVRIVVLSDSCHSGSVNKAITDEESVQDQVATAEKAAQHDPRFRALPRDKMVATYRNNKELYDGIQKQVPGTESTESQLGVTALLISGCQDDQLSRDGFTNGRFTEELKKVWADGAWQGGYPAFHEAIVNGMPPDQTPNYNPVGARTPTSSSRTPSPSSRPGRRTPCRERRCATWWCAFRASPEASCGRTAGTSGTSPAARS